MDTTLYFFKQFLGGGAQWEKSNKFVPLGKIRKIIFLYQIQFV
jgi:hypothetical protein